MSGFHRGESLIMVSAQTRPHHLHQQQWKQKHCFCKPVFKVCLSKGRVDHTGNVCSVPACRVGHGHHRSLGNPELYKFMGNSTYKDFQTTRGFLSFFCLSNFQKDSSLDRGNFFSLFLVLVCRVTPL